MTIVKLDLRYTKVTAAGLRHLVSLRDLDYLDLGHTMVTTDDVKALRAEKPDTSK